MSMTMMTRLLPAANDDEDADETDTPVDTPTYFVDASYSDREVPVVILDLRDLVNDARCRTMIWSYDDNR